MLLFQLQAVFERFSDTLCDFVIAVSIRVKSDGVNQGHVQLAVHHDAFVSGDVKDFADNAYAVVVMLIFDEFAFQAKRELVDDGSVNCLRLAGCQAASGELIKHLVSGIISKMCLCNREYFGIIT